MLTRLFLFFTLALLSVGCFETEDEYTLNADGSGKVVHKTYFQPLSFGDSDKTDSKTKLKEEVLEIIEQSEGVDAWSDVSYKMADDGRMLFQGTAYFPDINKLKIHQNVVLKLKKTNDASGNLVFEVDKTKEENKKDVKPLTLTEAEITAKVKEERAKYQQGKGMLAAFAGNIKHSLSATLPGTIQPSANPNLKDRKMTLRFEGKKVLDLLDKMVADDAFMRKQVISGQGLMKEGPADESAINEALFGSKEPVRAVVPKAVANFDYKAELAKAKQNFATVRKELGAAEAVPVVVAPAAGAGALKNARVVGIRIVSDSGHKDLRAFNYDPGVVLSVLVEFSGSVVQVEGSMVAAIADTGADLAPKKEWDRQIRFPQMSESKTAALIELRIDPPGADVKSFKELTADLTYTTAGGNKRVDLGFAELKEKSEGKELQSSITTFDKPQSDGSQNVNMKMRIDPDQIVNALLVLTDGKEIKLERRGYGGSRGGTYSYTFESKVAFPSDGKIVLEVFDKLQKIKAPLKLENIDLLGRPLSK